MANDMYTQTVPTVFAKKNRFDANSRYILDDTDKTGNSIEDIMLYRT